MEKGERGRITRIEKASLLALAGIWTARATRKYLSQPGKNSSQLGGKYSIVPVLDLIEDMVWLGLASQRLVDMDIGQTDLS